MIDTSFFDSTFGSLLSLFNPILALIRAVLEFFNALGAEGLF